MTDDELSMKQKGKLGGYRAAANMTPEERQARSRVGGEIIRKRWGKEYYARLAFRRWGKKVTLPQEETKPEKTRKRKPLPGQGEKNAEEV